MNLLLIVRLFFVSLAWLCGLTICVVHMFAMSIICCMLCYVMYTYKTDALVPLAELEDSDALIFRPLHNV
jgi:hypothetical protein